MVSSTVTTLLVVVVTRAVELLDCVLDIIGSVVVSGWPVVDSVTGRSVVVDETTLPVVVVSEDGDVVATGAVLVVCEAAVVVVS